MFGYVLDVVINVAYTSVTCVPCCYHDVDFGSLLAVAGRGCHIVGCFVVVVVLVWVVFARIVVFGFVLFPSFVIVLAFVMVEVSLSGLVVRVVSLAVGNDAHVSWVGVSIRCVCIIVDVFVIVVLVIVVAIVIAVVIGL